MTPLMSTANTLIQFLLGAYIFILLLRFILQKLNVSWYNPISRFIIVATQKPLIPFRKIIPRYQGYDISILVFAVLLQLIESSLLFYFQMAVMPHAAGLLLIVLAQLMSKLITIYTYAIVINAVSSWIPSMQGNPILQIIYLIVEPFLSIFRRYIPLIGGIDLSPIAALLALTLINTALVGELLVLGSKLI